MLEDLIKELTTLKQNLESINTDSPTEQQRVQLEELAGKVLKTFEDANIEIPEEYPDDSGIEIPTSEI